MSVRLLIGDCREVLRTLPAESVHCVVTSPPYFGLRDYGTAKWEGGNEGCGHLMPANGVRDKGRDRAASNGKFHDSPIPNQIRQQYSSVCPCGARRIDSQIGLEATPDAYVAEMVAVFREVRRVLRRDGVLFLNLGDSYAGGGNYRGINSEETLSAKQRSNGGARGVSQLLGAKNTPGLKPKDLIGIPWRVAFALQADGWWLRQDIIWAKANPMPESVTDRCTKAHEYLFLLTRSATYWYDAEAIAEPSVIGEGSVRNITPGLKGQSADRNDGDRFGVVNDGTRNKRSVWTVPSAPFSDAHFATFPPALIEPCIKAGCPEKACARCGAPWVRETVPRTDPAHTGTTASRYEPGSTANRLARLRQAARERGQEYVGGRETLSWSPSCACTADTVPGVVLDPFGGAGTTGLVADRLGRDCILIELNPAYAEMGKNRIVDDGPLFAQLEMAL